MEVSIKELRTQPGHYIKLAEAGAEIILTSHGAKRARIVPLSMAETNLGSKGLDTADNKQGFLYGMWADRADMEDVDAYIASIRKGRVF